MISLPAGSFTRGREHGRPDERPVHEVAVSAFEIDVTLVTRAAFARFVESSGYVTSAERAGFGIGAREGMDDWEWERLPGASWRRPFKEGTPGSDAYLRGDAPVVMVSFDDATAYCASVGKRLPTEAEWEYAMRAGSSGTRYPWGDDANRDGKIGLNYWQGESHHHNDLDDAYLYVSPVRAFPPNAWGIYDPVGNVWQWTADYYAPDTYVVVAHASPARDPHGPAAGRLRVLRGGSWWCGYCTCEGNGLFYRGKALPNATFNNNGFRCAR
jgi:formylglycine-generating enzyme required for sulfatase activity